MPHDAAPTSNDTVGSQDEFVLPDWEGEEEAGVTKVNLIMSALGKGPCVTSFAD
jgi:hypothetical protein